MYSCGLRISEAQTLTVPVIDSKNKVLHIIGKGDKERLVPLPQSTLKNLRALWVTHHHPTLIFPNQQGERPVATCVLYRTFRAAVQEARLPADVTPHTLRHSYATRLMEKGVDTRVVQILLGHESITSTAIYTHLTEPTRESLRAVINGLMVDL